MGRLPDNVKEQKEELNLKPKDIKKAEEIAKVRLEKQQEAPILSVAIVMLRKTGDFVIYFAEEYDIIRVDNCLYEWNGSKDYVFNVVHNGARYPANFYFEANPAAQPLRIGLERNLVIDKLKDAEGRILDGSILLDKLELTSARLGLFDKATKVREPVITEHNIHWLWIVIGAVVIGAAAFVVYAFF